MRILALVLSALLVAGPTSAKARIYDGDEVEALVCAYLYAFFGVVAAEEGAINPSQKRLVDVIGFAILTKYVSGTMDQKIRAMKVIGQRRTFLGTLRDFDQRKESCARRFPP